MSLIRCPDCNREVSSHANTCIFCGCPLDVRNITPDLQSYALVVSEIASITLLVESINYLFGIPKDTVRESIKSDPPIVLSGLTKENAEFRAKKWETSIGCVFNIIQIEAPLNIEYNNIIDKQREKANAPITCPRCGSTQITTGARGVSWTRGLIGASQTVNRCAKCGFVFKPGR